MKKTLLSLVLCGSLLCTALLPVQAAAQQPDSVTIEIVHTNDIHGRSSYQTDSVVGFDKLKTWIDQQDPDLILDAGDTFHGQAFATLEQGGSIAELVKEIGYDAMTPGNHDWNYGSARLKELGELAGTPVLAGNITSSGRSFFENDGTLVKTVDGVQVGVLGVFDQEIKDDTAPRNIAGLSFSNDAACATEMAARLREQGCEVVVALTHQLDCGGFIGQTSGIDAVIAGHEHAVFDEAYPDADGREVKLVEAGKYFENAGLLSITYDRENKRIESVDEQLLTCSGAGSLPSEPGMAALLEQISQRQKQQLTQVVGSTGAELDGRWENLRIEETSLGRVVTAAYLEETGADIAFENAGGIRLGKLLPPGAVTYQDIIDTAPYGNYIVTKQITGEAVLSILEKSIEIGAGNKQSYDEWVRTGSDQVPWPDDNGSYLQFGGMSVVYDPAEPFGSRVVSVQVGGEDLVLDKLYTVATNNYISLGKTYPELADVPEINQFAACDEALIRFFQKGGEHVNSAAGRACLQQAEKPAPAPSGQPEETSSQQQAVSSRSETPKTGDSAGWLVLCLPAAGFLALAARRRKGGH